MLSLIVAGLQASQSRLAGGIPALLLCLVSASLSNCIYLGAGGSKQPSTALPAVRDSMISQTRAGDLQSTPRALLIQEPELALSSRLEFVEAAQRSIDLQYFIWQNDYTGILMVEKLLQAADRGVRVRALIDDVRLIGLIDRVGALNQHPNIEIRIYNPFSVRMRFPFAAFQIAEFAIDGNRLNHRMHNKLLVVDNELAILGGRNIGDDYFGYSDDWYFVDTDLLISGPVVEELSSGFDVYWNSRWAYPVQALTRYSLFRYELEGVRERIRERLTEHPELAERMSQQPFRQTLAQLVEGNRVGSFTVLVDDPNLGFFDRPDTLATALAALAAGIKREVVIATPYLVPTSNLLDIGEELISRGVQVSVLTNSLATNNHTSAHAAYSRFRRRLLDMGVKLFEFRPDASLVAAPGGAIVTMHAKYMLFDDRTVFLGSMNLDPRSLYLNTELGVMLESRDLVATLRRSFDTMTRPENAYVVVNTPNGIEWHAKDEVLTSEPAHSLWQRVVYRFMQLLPLSSQL